MNHDLPRSPESEEEVLGSMLLDESHTIDTVLDLLKDDDFFSEIHTILFSTMKQLRLSDAPVNTKTVADALQSIKTANPACLKETWLDRISRSFLHRLTDNLISSRNVRYHAQRVKDAATRRLMIERIDEVKSLLIRDSNSLERISNSNGYFDLKVLATGARQLDNSPFGRGIISADAVPKAQVPLRLWFGLYPRSVVLLIGETGAGKSSFLYNLCIHAALNKALYGIDFGLSEPLRILYIDPENSGNFAEGQGGQCAVKMERIGQDKPKDLVFHDGQGVNLSRADHLHALAELIRREQFAIVIIDPIANLFQTKDENDNAEAAKQMTALTALSRGTGACIVPVHHTGKDTSGNYGRGASARLAAADVAMVFRCKGNDEEMDDTFTGELKTREDLCRLQIVKNRLEGRGSLYLQMAGEDKFSVSTFIAWKGRGHSSDRTTKKQKAGEEICLFLSDGKAHSRTNIQAQMRQEGYGRDAVDEALLALEKNTIVVSSRQGRGGSLFYELIQTLDEEDQQKDSGFLKML